MNEEATLDRAKKEGARLLKELDDENLKLSTLLLTRINATLSMDEAVGDDMEDDGSIKPNRSKELALLYKLLRTCTQGQVALTMRMALPLLSGGGASPREQYKRSVKKPETPIKFEIDPFPRQSLKDATFKTFDNDVGKCMLSGKDEEERIIVSIIYSLVACRSFLNYLSSVPKVVASKPLHKALVIVAKLVLFAKEAFFLDDTIIKRLIFQTKLPTDGLDPRIPHSYLVRIFTILFNEGTGKDLFNLKIYEGIYEENKFKAYLQQCGTFADTFVSHLATVTLCDGCAEEKQYFRTEPIFFCDSLSGDGVLVSPSDVINEKLVHSKPILNWSCDTELCKSKAGKMTVVVVVFPRVLVISFNRRNNKHPILKGPVCMDNHLRLYPYANGAEGTIYDLVSVLPYKGETIITKYGDYWKEINVSGPSIKDFAFEKDMSSDSCSLLFFVRREQNQDVEMEKKEKEEEEDEEGGDDAMKDENDEKEEEGGDDNAKKKMEEEEEEEEEGDDMDEDADETNGGEEFEKNAEDEEEDDEEKMPSTFADDIGQEDEENESSVKDKTLSTGHRGGQIGKSSIAPIVENPKAVESTAIPPPQSTRQGSKAIQPLDFSVLTGGKDLKRDFTSTGITPTSLRPLDGVGGPTRRDIIKKGRKGPQ